MNKSILTILLCLSAMSGWAQTQISGNVVIGFGPAASGGGGGFGAEVQRWSESSSAATTVITLTGGIAQNNTVVLTAFAQNTSMTISGVVDSKGNTYTVRVTQSGVAGDNMTLAIVTANASTALVIGDTITITWNSPVASSRMGAVDYLQNVSALDITKIGFGINNPITAAATCASSSVQFGAMWLHSGTTVYSGTAWTQIGTSHVFSGITLNYVQHVTASSGSQDPGGSINTATDWAYNWISMK